MSLLLLLPFFLFMAFNTSHLLHIPQNIMDMLRGVIAILLKPDCLFFLMPLFLPRFGHLLFLLLHISSIGYLHLP